MSAPPRYMHDSLNEGRVADLLAQAGLRFETQVPMPLQAWPWQTPRSRGAPKCDFHLVDSNIYVEVKGWMTLFGLAKSAWLSQQGFAYYFFQNDDASWEPFVDSPVPLQVVDRKSEASLRRSSTLQQIEELRHFSASGNAACGSLSRQRIRRHIEGRIATFRDWTGQFP